ncbi:protein Jade-1-like isoform X1 [Centruroides sculpturatus]|uniref:protein Jade-1-like isoform X1 n=1 Tax=Centruroides sculpturatus TaxID=218467 RepID=UPI000C6CF5E5|nr:protein Jade-1-like isoform X1 [Centruroides sculpturatus]XP_023215577.1 protein Jade-1-like isoform X1 [Centruroides sculpturatus]
MASTSASKGRNQYFDSKGSTGKKRRHCHSGSEDNDGKGTPLSKKYCGDLPLSKIYNSSFKSNKPAELFRKDLISAMKLPDTEQLNPEEYWIITDSWKQEWEKGVQVPVNPDALAEPTVRIINEKKKSDFRLPKKFIKCTQDKNFIPDIHVLSNATFLVDKVCSYDLDVVDIEWLNIMNEELKIIGLSPLEELTMEVIIEEIETQCYDNLQEVIKTEEGLGIEYDDDVICDVCRSPDSEEGNEMVFCDACNICVHQACYGITKIPEGSWVCRTCALGIRPSCILCPNRGGAMKSTRSGQKWTHVSCALWIPEVAIENVDKMEPITKIAEIPASRWSLVCSLCREKIGACIQCSVKTCKTAYHVTCAFEHGLAMKAIIDGEEEEDDVDLKSYCSKHTKEKKGLHYDDAKSSVDRKSNKRELEMSSEEKANARMAKMQKMEAEFYKYVNINEVAQALKLSTTVVDFVYQYWKLKRRANFNKPLIMPKSQTVEPVEVKEYDSIYARMKMFVHLRQDLERVNFMIIYCYYRLLKLVKI